VLINVATLIQESVGHARRYHADGERVAVPDDGYAQEITGSIRLIRSERGVLVSASLDLEGVDLVCSRCLEPFREPLHIEFDEEYVTRRDPLTGQRWDAEQDEFLIDARWHLDLSEAVRQYEQSTLPIQPLCRPDCAGLCPTCGHNLNEGTCGCDAPASTKPWSPLAGLAERLRMEESHGPSEA
jgi:uncharacterized protein